MRAFHLAVSAVVISLVVFAGANAATPVLGNDYEWESLFAPPFEGPPQMSMAIRCIDDTHCLVAGGSNGAGYGIYTFDGQRQGVFTRSSEPNMTLMIMALTAGGTADKPRATFGGFGFPGLSKPLQYLSNGTEWLASQMPPSFFFIVQSVHSTDDGEHVLALGQGPLVQTESLGTSVISHDGGATFTEVPIQVEPLTKECSFPNYAAMVDNQTWFVTLGGYPGEDQNNNNNNNNNNGIKVLKRHSRMHALVKDQSTGETSFRHHAFSKPHVDVSEKQKLCPFNGQIARTTDGGQTFTVLHASHNYTITKIACRTANHCVALAWGNEPVTGTPFDGVLVMKDGVTFNFVQKLTTDGYAQNTVAFADAQEVWIGGSYATQEKAAAVFWKSMDGGESWSESPVAVPEVEMVFDLTFSKSGSGTGFAVGITMFKTSTVMRYKKQSFAGFFTQSHCPPFAPHCNFACQNISFPQGMCLEAPGGAAKAYCNGSAVVQEMYDTTSCVGSPYKNTAMPIDQCLNGTNVFFINYCNTSSLSASSVNQQQQKM